MKEPVSIIVPTYNREALLGGALDSILAQTYPYFEIIVVDDGSTDNTGAGLKKYQDDRISVVRQENKGPAAARNAGIKAARYDLLAFLDSDDRFAPQKLAVQVAAMAEEPAYLISHTEEIWYRRGKHLNQKKIHQKGQGDIFSQCLKLCAVGMSTVMTRRGVFDRVGFFNESLLCCEDYDLWVRTSAVLPFLLVDKPLTIKHGGRPDQVSVIHRVGMDRWRIKALLRLLESGALSESQRVLAGDELAKKCRIYGAGCLKHGKKEEGEKYLALSLNPARQHSYKNFKSDPG